MENFSHLRENGHIPSYHEVSDFFKFGKNLIEVNAEMFGGSSGFIAQFSFGKGKEAITLVTDQSWEVQMDKKWIPAKVVHTYGPDPGNEFLIGPFKLSRSKSF